MSDFWPWQTRRLREALITLLRASEGQGDIVKAQAESARVLKMLGEPPDEPSGAVRSNTAWNGGQNVRPSTKY
jgi:hypothetical protein